MPPLGPIACSALAVTETVIGHVSEQRRPDPIMPVREILKMGPKTV